MNDIKHLRQYRISLGLKQRDVATRLGICPQLVTMVELGRYPSRVEHWTAEIVRVLREEDERRNAR